MLGNKNGRRAALLLCGAAFLSFSCLGCKNELVDEVTLQVGPDEIIRFRPQSGFAHYFEMPGGEDVLRIFLASYDLSCQEFRAPGVGDVLVAVTLRAPASRALVPERYPWNGLVDPEEASDDEAEPPGLQSLPFVRLAEDARPLPPGGELVLKKLEAEPLGLVEGELAFRDADVGEAATTALIGSFSVRLCQVGLDEARKGPPADG
jgi:hypothetical protein